MLLKEDYFKDLEITDDDIASSDSDAVFNSDEIYYDTPADYYNAMTSKFTHYLIFTTPVSDFPMHTINWTVEISHMYKKLSQLFDVYGIEYSQLTVVEPVASIHLKNKFKNCKFFDFYGYKLITDCNSLEEFTKSSCAKRSFLNMVLFFNLPKLQSYKTVCTFVGKIMKCLWSNKFIDRCNIFDVIKLLKGQYNEINLYNPQINPYSSYRKIDKSTIKPDSTVVDILNLFFPEKSRDMIYNELNNDTQLQLKLYQCFPD